MRGADRICNRCRSARGTYQDRRGTRYGARGGLNKGWKSQGLLAIKATTLRYKVTKPHETQGKCTEPESRGGRGAKVRSEPPNPETSITPPEFAV
jgi:hypothetical protein